MRAAPVLAVAALLGPAAHAADGPALPRLGACGLAPQGFLLPGTEACLTFRGFVRAEGGWRVAAPAFGLAAPAPGLPPRPAAGLGRSTIGASARLSADLRWPTELRPLRVFVSLRGHNGVATDRPAR